MTDRWVDYRMDADALAKLPPAGTEVLLWAVEDYWDDEVHIVTGSVHMGDVREHEGTRYLTDYMDTAHSFIAHWMPLPAPPQQSSGVSNETCNCPCCQQGIEAPHEYHLERRPMAMSGMEAFDKALGSLLAHIDTKAAADAPVLDGVGINGLTEEETSATASVSGFRARGVNVPAPAQVLEALRELVADIEASNDVEFTGSFLRAKNAMDAAGVTVRAHQVNARPSGKRPADTDDRFSAVRSVTNK